MFKMSDFSVDRGRQMTPPIVDGVVHNRLVQFAQHGDQTLAQLVDVLGTHVACPVLYIFFWFR